MRVCRLIGRGESSVRDGERARRVEEREVIPSWRSANNRSACVQRTERERANWLDHPRRSLKRWDLRSSRHTIWHPPILDTRPLLARPRRRQLVPYLKERPLLLLDSHDPSSLTPCPFLAPRRVSTPEQLEAVPDGPRRPSWSPHTLNPTSPPPPLLHAVFLVLPRSLASGKYTPIPTVTLRRDGYPRHAPATPTLLQRTRIRSDRSHSSCHPIELAIDPSWS